MITVKRLKGGFSIQGSRPEFEALRLLVGLGLENIDTDTVEAQRHWVRLVLRSPRFRSNPLAHPDVDKRPTEPVGAWPDAETGRGFFAVHDGAKVYALGTSARAAEKAARKSGVEPAGLKLSPMRRALFRRIRRQSWSGRFALTRDGTFVEKPAP